MRIQGKEAAARFVLDHFPDCSLAVLGGSGGRNEHNPYSDLDIVIADDSAENAYRKTVKAYGWIIEYFVLTGSTYRDLFDEGIRASNPSLQRMLNEGQLIRCENSGVQILEEARGDLSYGPMPLSLDEINFQRYLISDLLEDIRGEGPDGELWFSVNRLAVALSEFYLRVNRQWIAEGKHLFGALRTYDQAVAQALESSLRAFYGGMDEKPLEALALKILSPYGGQLLDGFEQENNVGRQ